MKYIRPGTLEQARILFSLISQTCYKAGAMEGDLDKALEDERFIVQGLRTTTLERFNEIYSMLCEADKANPVYVRDYIKGVLNAPGGVGTLN